MQQTNFMAKLEEKLVKSILHGLSLEWKNALDDLPTSLAARMCKPAFSLKEMERRWGYWSGVRKEICLSRRLVLEHPWDAVREVLLHEMAHQLAEEALDGEHHPPHGPPFREACRLLRANPKASGDYPLLDERLAASSPHQEDRMLIRVQKLLSLATSRNRHEAEAAMAKAHELIKRYNLDLLARREKREFVSIFLGRPALRHTRDHYHLSALLLSHYSVDGIWIPAYVVEKGRMGRVLEVSGTAANVQIAAYVHDFIRRFIEREWQVYNRVKGLNAHRRTDFAVGIVEGFAAKLRQKPPSARETAAAPPPMKIEDPLLKGFMRDRYPHIQSFSRRTGYQDPAVIRDGAERGKALVISKGITQKGDEREAPRLLDG